MESRNESNDNPNWLEWAQRLQAIAQSGLAYCKNEYDIERYHQIREVAAEILAAGSGEPLEVVRGLLENQAGYATPKVDARGVVFREGKILLVKELADGLWTLPGGWVDVGEPPSLAVEREVREESGFEVKATRLLALHDRNLHGHPPFPFHTYKLFFLCELTGGEASTSLETGGAEFFARDALPPLSIMRTVASQIERMFELAEHPDWPTDFD